eukprot:11491592-Alexandrium_andersonii.AAC.1
MSASLVGSEMCIRDSIHWRAHGVHASGRPSHSAAKPQFAAELVHRMPVSYTHLTLPTICSV